MVFKPRSGQTMAKGYKILSWLFLPVLNAAYIHVLFLNGKSTKM
jgi:hypothetical protein